MTRAVRILAATPTGMVPTTMLAATPAGLVPIITAPTQPPATPAAAPDPGLFFATPPAAATSPRKVFAHWFAPYPIRINNVTPASDYYAVNYLRTDGEATLAQPAGTHVAFGGLLRDRPIIRPVGAGDWKTTDYRLDIANARAAGMDGFWVDILGGPAYTYTTGTTRAASANWTRTVELAAVAAAEFPGFVVGPMLDCNGTVAGTTTDGTTSGPPAYDYIADVIAALAPTAHWLPDGRMLLGSFKQEGKSPAWWDTLIARIFSRHGITVAVIGVYNNTSTSGTYTQYGAGRWGTGADPATYAARSDFAAVCASRGQVYMADVWGQDVRPNAGWFDEARGFRAALAAWDDAIAKGAAFAQVCTWSDFSEGGQWCPTPMRGRVMSLLNAWKAAHWKTGVLPQVLRDVVMVAHRSQLLTATILGPQTSFMVQNNTRVARSPLTDRVHVMTLLTAPATLEVTVAGVTTTILAPAGMALHEVNAAAGTVSARVTRGGTQVAAVTSPISIAEAAWQQDRQYVMCDSLTGTTGQFNVLQTATGASPTYPIAA